MSESLHNGILAIDGCGTGYSVALKRAQSIVAIETCSANALSAINGAVSQIPRGLGGVARRTKHRPFRRNGRPSDFGTIAPQVTAQAEQSDALGVRAMAAGALEIAQSLRSIGRAPGIAICLAGGTGPQVKAYLPDAKRADLPEPAGDPLLGALALASELVREATQ